MKLDLCYCYHTHKNICIYARKDFQLDEFGSKDVLIPQRIRLIIDKGVFYDSNWKDVFLIKVKRFVLNFSIQPNYKCKLSKIDK